MWWLVRLSAKKEIKVLFILFVNTVKFLFEYSDVWRWVAWATFNSKVKDKFVLKCIKCSVSRTHPLLFELKIINNNQENQLELNYKTHKRVPKVRFHFWTEILVYLCTFCNFYAPHKDMGNFMVLIKSAIFCMDLKYNG